VAEVDEGVGRRLAILETDDVGATEFYFHCAIGKSFCRKVLLNGGRCGKSTRERFLASSTNQPGSGFWSVSDLGWVGNNENPELQTPALQTPAPWLILLSQAFKEP
jgi:hypothetical protein